MKRAVKIDIIRETKQRVPSLRWWKKIIQQAIEALEEKKNVSLTIIFISPLKIKTLNKSWREKNEAGMILSFPVEQPKYSLFLSEKFIGDIFLCPQLIQKEAKKHNITTRILYKQLIIHGILHLYGYSHKLNKDWKKMKAMENKILNNIQ